MNAESPLLEILITKMAAEKILDLLPQGPERRKLVHKIVACDLAINFLKANSESTRQALLRIPADTAALVASQNYLA
jgi:hypothetical protein